MIDYYTTNHPTLSGFKNMYYCLCGCVGGLGSADGSCSESYLILGGGGQMEVGAGVIWRLCAHTYGAGDGWDCWTWSVVSLSPCIFSRWLAWVSLHHGGRLSPEKAFLENWARLLMH